MRVLSWMIALCGLWEAGDIVLPLVVGFGRVQPFVWSHIIAGIILVIIGAWGAMTRNVGTSDTMNWVTAAAGIWLIMAPFILGARVIAGGRWNDIAVGIIVLILAGASRLLWQRRA